MSYLYILVSIPIYLIHIPLYMPVASPASIHVSTSPNSGQSHVLPFSYAASKPSFPCEYLLRPTISSLVMLPFCSRPTTATCCPVTSRLRHPSTNPPPEAFPRATSCHSPMRPPRAGHLNIWPPRAVHQSMWLPTKDHKNLRPRGTHHQSTWPPRQDRQGTWPLRTQKLNTRLRGLLDLIARRLSIKEETKGRSILDGGSNHPLGVLRR